MPKMGLSKIAAESSLPGIFTKTVLGKLYFFLQVIYYHADVEK